MNSAALTAHKNFTKFVKLLKQRRNVHPKKFKKKISMGFFDQVELAKRKKAQNFVFSDIPNIMY